MIVVLGSFEIDPADAGKAAELAGEMAVLTRQEAGCVEYSFGWDLTQPNRLLLQERWATPEALQAHFATDHMKWFSENLRTITITSAEAARYEISNVEPIPVGSGAS